MASAGMPPSTGAVVGPAVAPAMRRRRWAEHPLSIPINLSWTFAILYGLVLLPIADAPALAWVAGLCWAVANIVATVVVRARLEVAAEPETPPRGDIRLQGSSLMADAMRRLRRNQLATISAGVLALMVLLCGTQQIAYRIWKRAVAPAATAGAAAPAAETDASFFDLHLDHVRINEEETYAPPSARHWFGTDSLGRDLFARTLYGGWISFAVGLVATLVSLVIGVTWGATAGYFGGRIDHLMMRIVDVLYGLPFIFLVILIMALVQGLHQTAKQNEPAVHRVWELRDEGRAAEAEALAAEKEITPAIETAVFLTDRQVINPLFVMFFALGLVQWLTMARITRGQVLSLKEREFVVAARVIGAGNARIIARHIIPNLLGPVIVYTTLTIPAVMLSEAFLSFIGLGISEPHCSWGTLASDGIGAINVIKPYWWLVAYPSVAISMALFSLNFIGDGLRDALDPRQQR